MKSITLVAVVLLALATPVWAGVSQGVAAYERGKYATAMRMLLPLAEKNDAKAQFYIGSMYEGGFSVEQDYDQAVEWYEKAAEQQMAKAQYHLGLLYEIGEGVGRDYVKAVEWHRRAAELGHSPAQSNLARLYLGGLGVEVDLVQAYAWSNVAVQMGFGFAEKFREKASGQMSTLEIAEANLLVAEWLVSFGR